MKIALVIIAVLCGAIALLTIPTGSFTVTQILGVGVISAALASVAP